MAKDKPIPSAVRFFVLHRDGFACRYCNHGIADGAVLEIDHIHPRSKGGTDDPENLCIACRDCNGGKNSTEGVTPPLKLKPAATPGLVGKCFVIFGDKGKPDFAGIVRSDLGSGHFLLQYFDAFTGDPSTMAIKHASMMALSAHRERGAFEFFEDIPHLDLWLKAHDQ